LQVAAGEEALTRPGSFGRVRPAPGVSRVREGREDGRQGRLPGEQSGDGPHRPWWLSSCASAPHRKGTPLHGYARIFHLRFDAEGKVILQQNVWDSTAGILERIPVLGAAIRAIERRI